VRGAEKLAAVLRDSRADVELFRILATLVDTVDVGQVDDWKWHGPCDTFQAQASQWGVPQLAARAESVDR